LVSFLFLSGCIQVQTRININKDGSGTVEETVLMSDEMVSMINEFITGFSTDSTAKPEEFKLYKEEDLRSRVNEMGEGVSFVSGSEIKNGGKEGYKVLYSFTDLNKLKISQDPDSKIQDDVGATTTEEGEKKYVTFSFTKGETSEIKINLPEPEKDDDEATGEDETDKDSVSNNDLSEMKFFLKDLSFSLTASVNGEIVETNSEYKEGSEITLFNLNFGELLESPEKLEELQKINNEDFIELKRIMKDIPGIKIETNDPVVIRFK
jgi:hypothetical protein